MCHRLSGLATYIFNDLEREMSTLPMLRGFTATFCTKCSLCIYRDVIISSGDGFRHAQPNSGPTKKEASTGQRMLNSGTTLSGLWASLWRVATVKRSLGAARHSLALYAFLRNMHFTTLTTSLFPLQKTYVHFYRTGPSRV